MKKTDNFVLVVLFLFPLLNLFCSNESSEQLYQKGKVFAESGNIKKAYEFFKNASKKDPENTTYLISAGSTAPDQNAAYVYFKNAWEKGAKNNLVLSNLIKLSFHVDKNEKLSYAISLYDQLPDTLKTYQFKGELFFQFGIFDSAISIWKKQYIESPSPELSNSISLAYINKKEIDSALNVLLDSKKSGIVNAQTYIQLSSLFASKMDFKAVNSLFTEIQNSVFDNSLTRLEFAAFFLIHDNIDKAFSLLDIAEHKVPADQEAFVLKKLRCMKAFIAITQNRVGNIDTLITEVKKSSDETALFNAFKAVLNNDSMSLKMVEDAREKNSRDPFIDIICARSNFLSRNYEKAIAYYQSLPGIIQWSPRILTELIISYAAAGKEEEALKRINFMHKHGIFTKRSLEIFRDITFRKDLIDKSSAAQKLLEKQYGNDINVKWHSLLLSIKNNNYDNAEVIIDELIKRVPDNERFKSTRFSIMFLKKDFQRIIKELPASGLPEERAKQIEAMAWLKSGDTVSAIKALEQSVQKFHNLQLMIELAQMYLNTKNNSKAASVYREIVNHTETSKVDSGTTAALLNNYAWVLSSSENGDLMTALDAAKRAYNLLPGNINIIDTYASILLKASKYKDCIRIIENNQAALKHARLIHYLAQAYEKTDNLNKAKRYYEDVLSIDPTDDLPLTESKQMIRQHIEEMTSEK